MLSVVFCCFFTSEGNFVDKFLSRYKNDLTFTTFCNKAQKERKRRKKTKQKKKKVRHSIPLIKNRYFVYIFNNEKFLKFIRLKYNNSKCCKKDNIWRWTLKNTEQCRWIREGENKPTVDGTSLQLSGIK